MSPAKNTGKKQNTKKNYNRREPYQRQASTENAGARIGMGMLFILLGAVTAVSYFIQEGSLVLGIRNFLSGILGYGYWALAVCFVWVAVIIFQGRPRSGIRIFCILLIPVLFSSFIDLLSFSESYGTDQVNTLFEQGKNFKSGGVISGLLVSAMVSLLSKIGTGVVIFILLVVCVAMAVSEPQEWYGASNGKGSRSSARTNSRSGYKAQQSSTLRNVRATASGVGATLGTIWNGEGNPEKKQKSFASSLIHMNDDNGGDTIPDLRDETYATATAYIPDAYDQARSAPEPEKTYPESRQEPSTESRSRRSLFEGIDRDEEQPVIAPIRTGRSRAGTRAQKPETADAAFDTASVENTDSDSPDVSAVPGRTPAQGIRQSAVEASAAGDKASRESAVREGYSGIESSSRLRPSAPERYEQEFTASRQEQRPSAGRTVRRMPPVEEQMEELFEEESVEEASEEDSYVPRHGAPSSAGPGGAPARMAASSRNDIKDPEKITRKDANKAARSIASQISKNAGTQQALYEFPPVTLLNQAKPATQDSDREIYENKIRLENALHSFGVNSSVVKTTHGPTVTRYDIELEQGVKLTKVTNLSNDLALSLGVSSVRIAPIPDEISTVGIEVPNKIVNTVSLREILESEEFSNAKSRLSFAIGKDISGKAIVGNISKLPHMLIAGTTGSGKSVCMNSLIISLLYKSRPEDVKLIMIDPKMVELGIYNSIPHLYVPVVTEPKKAAGALQWSVVEMLKRYRLFSEVGMRDLSGYNTCCRNNGEQPLPQVVIVIDELADLMMAASKEVEESICRIAQMGRAAGMHLVIATQRPSADVITGLMKANIPSRIAFAVSSALESRIILDQAGADKLIGMGDMLYAPIGCGKPQRVQGAFVSDEEREKIIKFISAHSTFSGETNDELRQFMDKAMEGKGGSGSGGGSDASSGDKSGGQIAEGYDEMLPDAVEVVLEMKSCSVSMLQRRIKLGYSRAARIVDQMEELGIVGPYEGAKPRSVPITRDDWEFIKAEKLGLGGSKDDYALAADLNDL